MLLALLLVFPTAAMSQSSLFEQVSEDVFLDAGRNLFWQVKRMKKTASKEGVDQYLSTLNQGEHNDWRLPTKQELFRLFSVFDLKRNGTVKIRLEGSYWLADAMGLAHVGAWEIGDQCGPIRTFYQEKAGYIRAIRP